MKYLIFFFVLLSNFASANEIIFKCNDVAYEKNTYKIDKKNNKIYWSYVLTDQTLQSFKIFNKQDVANKIGSSIFNIKYIDNIYISGERDFVYAGEKRSQTIEINLIKREVRSIFRYENSRDMENTMSCK